MEEGCESRTSPPMKTLDTVLTVAAVAAFTGAALAGGGAFALPLMILGGGCIAGSLIAGSQRERGGDYCPCSEANPPRSSVASPTPAEYELHDQQDALWAAKIESLRQVTASRSR